MADHQAQPQHTTYSSESGQLLVTTTPTICAFNGCNSEATKDGKKCKFHRNRRQCSKPDCTNQVYARMLCVRHGGKKRCTIEGMFFKFHHQYIF